mgnify:CR=1 FL=1
MTCCFAGIGGFREIELTCESTIILGGRGGGISGVVGIDTGGGGGGRFLNLIGRSGGFQEGGSGTFVDDSLAEEES